MVWLVPPLGGRTVEGPFRRMAEQERLGSQETMKNGASMTRRKGLCRKSCNRQATRHIEKLKWDGDSCNGPVAEVPEHQRGCWEYRRETPRAELVGPFGCGECDALFSSQDHLDRHRKTAHRKGEGRHQCRHCPYSSNRKHSMVAHERTHTGETPFVCPTCGKAFTQQGHLATHRRVHSGERPYVCSECGKRFTQNSALMRHVRMHSGARLHVCHVCGYRGVDPGSLRKHVIAAHSME